MELDINKSIIYDTIKYFDVYFNYEKLEKEMLMYSFELDKAFKFYNNIKKISYKSGLMRFFFFE